MRNRWWVTTTFAAAMLTLAACSSAKPPAASGGSPSNSASSPATGNASAANASNAVKTAKIGGATVLTNSAGFTLYWFAPDTSTESKCYGTCAQNWPPVKGPATASAGLMVMGTFGTITRTGGSVQATYDGHPLYTFAGDTDPGQAKGNNLNASGGVWHEVTASGSVAPAPSTSPSSSSGSGGYGY
jgi:predicted lipoprotein with Yx(FWY)xxD motif